MTSDSDQDGRAFDETQDMDGAGVHASGAQPDDIVAQLEAEGFEIIEELGRGGMGVVFKAMETSLRREVALKVLSPAIAGDPVAAMRFRREAILAANLHHPSIVPVFSIDSCEPARYFTMEFVRGRSLRQRVDQDGCLATDQALWVATEVLDALQHAHAANVVHRDIKPANIMWDDSGGRVRVTDFGIAQDVSGTLADTTQKTEGDSVGTPAFMSPEQNLGDPIDGRSDIYSTGATLYYALTGRLPYQARNRQQLAAAFFRQAPIPPSQLNSYVPQGLDAIVMRMLAIDPALRYPDCRSVLHDLRNYASGRKPAKVVAPRSKSHRWVVSLLVLALLGGAAAAVLTHPEWVGLTRPSGAPPTVAETPTHADPTPPVTDPDPTPPLHVDPEPVVDPTPDPTPPLVDQPAFRQIGMLMSPELDSRYGYFPVVNEKYIAFGAPRANGRRGRVYVCDAQTGGSIAELVDDAGQPGDQFGNCVAVDGDVMVVGADAADDGAGSVIVFRNDGAGWQRVAKLTASDRLPNDRFGRTVDIHDGTIVVGAPGKNEGGRQLREPREGAAYVFESDSGPWRQTAKLVSPTRTTGEVFGFEVAVDGDAIVVGAPAIDIGGAGAAYLFHREASGQWTRPARLASADDRDTGMGFDVAISGETIVVGHDGRADEHTPRSGAVYLFDRATGRRTARLASPKPADGDQFGRQVDIDAARVAVSCEGEGAMDHGRAYLFASGPDGRWGEVVSVIPDDSRRGDGFGAFVAIAGNRVVAASKINEAVYLFEVAAEGAE